jgi:hypothetical protein
MVETLFIKAILSSYFSDLASEFPLTYRSELIDEDSVRGEEIALNLPTGAVYTKHKVATNPITQPLSPPLEPCEKVVILGKYSAAHRRPSTGLCFRCHNTVLRLYDSTAVKTRSWQPT